MDEGMRICAKLITMCLIGLAGCRTQQLQPPQLSLPENVSDVSREEAIGFARKLIESDDKLSGYYWLKGEPFYVGPWEGYIQICKEKNLVCTLGFGAGTEGVVFVIFRLPFLPQGGGREDIFGISVRNRKVTYYGGIKGR